MLGLLNQTVKVAATTQAEDEHGYPVETAGTPKTYRGRLNQIDSSEALARGDDTTTTWRLFLEPGAAITAHSVVTIDGLTYHVVGDPDRVNGAVGEHHVEALVQRREQR